MKRRISKLVILALGFCSTALLLTGCMPGDGANSGSDLAGFFTGIWHGWIAPISLIRSIFDHRISIYETYNTGFFYNLGYYMAIISGFGGLALSRKHEKRSK